MPTLSTFVQYFSDERRTDRTNFRGIAQNLIYWGVQWMVRISNTLTKQGVPKIISRTKGFLHQPVREGLGTGEKIKPG